MEREVKLNSYLRCLRTDVNADKGNRINKRRILPFCQHLAVYPEMSFWSLRFAKPRRHCAGECAQNGAKPLSQREAYGR